MSDRSHASASRRAFLCGAFPAIIHARPASTTGRPNILWILGDDLGVELGCYGFPLVHTPNMDRLAAEGVRFTQAHTTAPVCSASRSAFNVGLYQTTTDTHHHRSHRRTPYPLTGGARLVTDRLRERGYFTANVLDIAPGVRGTGKTDFNFEAKQPFDGTHWNQRRPGQPFYAQVNFQAPHKGPAFTAARKQTGLVDPAKVPLAPYWPDHPVVRDEVANYLDAVNLLDTQVGVLLEALGREGLLDSTVVFLFGDNGRCLIRGKQWLYQPGTNVPLLVRWPGELPKGVVREDPVSILDVTASTLAFASVPLPPVFHGRPLFGGRPRDHVITARDRCDMTVDRIRCVRGRRYSYIRNFMPERPHTQFNEYIQKQYPTLGVLKDLHEKGRLTAAQALFMQPRKPEVEFYDRAIDPYEIDNLAGSPEHRKPVAEYAGMLERWVAETKDRGGEPETEPWS